jgi:methionyl-tRNA synthetase
MAPWVLAKTDKTRLSTVMSHLVESLKLVSVLIWPFMPETAEKMQTVLQLPKRGGALGLKDIRGWGDQQPLAPASKAPQLFPRIEVKRDEKAKFPKGDKRPKPLKTISFKEFQGLDLRVGVIREVESIPKSKKLIKLIVDMGEERVVVAGIAGHFDEADLIGKQVIVVANLEPAKLMGVESQGMVLAAEDESGLHLITTDGEAIPGSRVK